MNTPYAGIVYVFTYNSRLRSIDSIVIVLY